MLSKLRNLLLPLLRQISRTFSRRHGSTLIAPFGKNICFGDRNHGSPEFRVNLGTCSITRVELCGILTSLILAWDAGYMKVIVKTDSQVVVTLLADRAEVHHHHTLEVIQLREL
ncbi:hypothetical protein LINPERHAP2_LOCUS28660 [Linum perenne]